MSERSSDGVTHQSAGSSGNRRRVAAQLGVLVRDDRAVGYRQAAEATTLALVNHYLDARGLLSHGCYNKRIGLATQNELIWGSYYLFEALAILTGKLEPARI